MLSFQIESSLHVSVSRFIEEQLTFDGVNRELRPWFRMTAPGHWRTDSILDWPTHHWLFTSTILAMGAVPVDRHRFRLLAVYSDGFLESSSSFFNRCWQHERRIQTKNRTTHVIDRVSFEPRVKILGQLAMSLYRSVFRHRHRRLKARYGEP